MNPLDIESLIPEEEVMSSLELFDGEKLAKSIFDYSLQLTHTTPNGFYDTVEGWCSAICFAYFYLTGQQFVKQLMLWDEVLYGEHALNRAAWIPEDYRVLNLLISKMYNDFLTRIEVLLSEKEEKND